MYWIGVDLGTSALKLLLVDEAGAIERSASREYPLLFPYPGWSEQEPEQWWNALVTGMHELLEGVDASKIAGIGVGGQMHGLVTLDASDNVIRPAILWNDGRTDRETEWLNTVIGKERLSTLTGNIAFAGFTAPKILWMRKNEPELFSRVDKIMLPKDYLNYRLTGVHACDYSDASGMLLLDVEHRCWSREMLEICGVETGQLPDLFESSDVIGTVLPEVAALLGIPACVKVAAGAGDNAAAAVGTGTVTDGACNISLGTSGTIFIASDRFGVDPNNGLHAFAHANGAYHLMGCMLSAASCNKWFCEDILHTADYAEEQEGMEERFGKNRVFFLPYLMGERSPINDIDARGTFVGLSMDTTRRDMVQAVLEGVAFAIRDCFEVARSIGVSVERSMLCGGGAQSRVWQKILSSVLNIPLDLPKTVQGPGYGAAMLAMVATGFYPDVQTAARSLIRVESTVYPDPDTAKAYEAAYRRFDLIYPALKAFYKECKA